MKEILQISVGQCGIRTGSEFIKELYHDHQIDQNGVCQTQQQQELSIFFNEQSNNTYIPRSVFIDVGDQTINQIKTEQYNFDPNCYLYSNESTSSFFAKGRTNMSCTLLDQSMDTIRKQIEKCDCCQGIQLTHATGGGTGSGSAIKLSASIREQYGSEMIYAYTVFPHLSQINPLEIYNTVFSVHSLVELIDFVVMHDNLSLDKRLSKIPGYPRNFQEYNKLIAANMIQTTCTSRFPCEINSGLRKLAVNLIPFPRLHFLVPNYLPFTSKNFNEDILKLLNQSYFLTDMGDREQLYMTQAVTFRGNYSHYSFQTELQKQTKGIEWIADTNFITYCDKPHRDFELIAGYLGNHRRLGQIYFPQLGELFTQMFRRKAYLYLYLQEGMDEMEFTESESNMNDLVSEYYEYCCMATEEDEVEEDEEYQ